MTSASGRRPAGVFPLLHMLDVMPGVFQDHLLPALQGRHKAALAATCTALRSLVQQKVHTLQLCAGKCCLVHADRLAPKLPHVSSIVLKPGNLHEAMFVLPIFFLQDARFMPGIRSLQLLDQLPDKPPQKLQCGSCNACASTYDLSAILATAATCMPALQALAFSTHYISDAECAAIALMTGLTKLQLCSNHGTKLGGLSRLTSLDSLAELRLLDSNRHCDTADVAMLLSRSRLTHLQLGHYPSLTPPLLASLVELGELASAAAAATAAAAGAGTVRNSLLSGALPGSSSTATSSSRGSAAAGEWAVPPPPSPLRELSIVLSPYMTFARDALVSAAGLTKLTRLSIGWLLRPEHELASESVDVVMPPGDQKQLSQLVALRQLALGWTVSYEVLGALGYLTGLTELQLGGLPQPAPPATLRLPSVKSLITHLREPFHNPQMVFEQQGLGLLRGLAVFFGLTRLELTGAITGAGLTQLPRIVAPGLRELLLPQRLARSGWAELSSLRVLTGLTSLRLGWRAGLHQGPPTWPEEPAEPDDDPMNMWFWDEPIPPMHAAAAPVGMHPLDHFLELLQEAQHQAQVGQGIFLQQQGQQQQQQQGQQGQQEQQEQQQQGQQQQGQQGQQQQEQGQQQQQGQQALQQEQALEQQALQQEQALEQQALQQEQALEQQALQQEQALEQVQAADVQQVQQGGDNAAAGAVDGIQPPGGTAAVQEGAAPAAAVPTVISLSALTQLLPGQAAAAAEVAAAEPSAAAAAPGPAAAGAPAYCSTCGTPATAGCFCRLQRLELVGPVSGGELQHLAHLPALRTLLLRDNACWSSGLPCTDLAAFAVSCSSLRRLELIGCQGVDGLVLEKCVQAVRPEGPEAGPDSLDLCDLVVRPGGKRADELGMAHQYMGTVISPAEERGEGEQLWWGAAAGEEGEEGFEGFEIGPLPQPPPLQLA